MVEVLVVGAGPAGLACAVALRCHGLGDAMTVLDPAGGWLTAWHDRFARQDIPHLRSPAVHHPHPEPFALLAAGGTEGLVPSGGAKLPTTSRFARFTDDLVAAAGLTASVVPAAARSLTLDASGRATVTDDRGRRYRPDRVVLAHNRRQPQLPAGLRDARAAGCVRLTDEVDVRRTVPGSHVVVVGGGLSAAHLAVGAARRGARVTLVTRRRLMVRRYDVHPTWLGPKKLRPFTAEPDPERRRTAIDHARGGGSVPHRMRALLAECEAAGTVRLHERVEVLAAEPRGDRVRVELSDGLGLEASEVWAATGGRVDVAADPLCAPLLARFPIPVAGGLPELSPDLSWPGSNVHLSGFATALSLGPTAGNLIGHRRAALRITASLRGEDPVRADRITTGAAACPALPARRLEAALAAR